MALKVHILAESTFMREANGIYTAVQQLKNSLAHSPQFSLSPNPFTAHVIHAHTVGARYLFWSLLRRQRLIVTAHVTADTCKGGVRMQRLCQVFTSRYLKLAYNRARIVIAVSPAVREELEKMSLRSEVVTLCNSVDRNHFRPSAQPRRDLRRRYGIRNDEFVVLCVGQAQPRKGIWDFIRVAEMLPELRFVWVGGRPFGRVTADYHKIGRLFESPPPNVIFAGQIPYERIPDYYTLADAFFFPSYQECFGYAILEAATMHLPLLLRDNPEYHSYFLHHYLKAEDNAGFAKVLRRLSADRDYRRAWQQEARQLSDRYTFESYLNQITGQYLEVARGDDRRSISFSDTSGQQVKEQG